MLAPGHWFKTTTVGLRQLNIADISEYSQFDFIVDKFDLMLLTRCVRSSNADQKRKQASRL